MKTPQEKYKPNILYTCRCKKPSVKCQQMKSHGITKTLRTRTLWEMPREHKPCNREQASDQIQPSTLKPLGKPGGVGDSPTQQRAGKADPQRTPDRERPRLSLGVRSEAGPLVSPQRLIADRSSGKSREKGARERLSTVSVFEGMKIKTPVRRHLAASGSGAASKVEDNRCWRGGGEAGPPHRWWERTQGSCQGDSLAVPAEAGLRAHRARRLRPWVGPQSPLQQAMQQGAPRVGRSHGVCTPWNATVPP